MALNFKNRLSLTPLVFSFIFFKRSQGLFLLMFIIINLIVFSVQADVIEQFCLTQDREKPDTGKVKGLSVPVVKVNFMAKEKRYHLISGEFGYRFVIKLQDENNNELSHFLAPQVVFLDEGVIRKMAVSKDGLLWIKGEYTDYVAPIDLFTTPPTIGGLVNLNELTDTECSFLAFSFGCRDATSYYSYALERIFVYSNAPSPIDIFPANILQVIKGKPREMPTEITRAYHHFLKRKTEFSRFRIYDLPVLKGVVFDGGKGKVLFYDGDKVTSLINPKIYGKDAGWRLYGRPDSKKVYLSIMVKGKRTLVRIESSLKLIPILLPDAIANVSLMQHNIPELKMVLWKGMGDDSDTLNIEISDTLETLIIAPKPIKIWWLKYFINGLGEGVFFNAYNTETKQGSDYFIVRKTDSTECIAKFDLENPIILGSQKKM